MRLLRKFQENEFEKVERLIELHEQYYERVEKADQAFRAEFVVEVRLTGGQAAAAHTEPPDKRSRGCRALQ